LNVVAWRTYPDHHAYTREDIDSLRSWAKMLPPDSAVVTTQKDIVKIALNDLGDRELWALQIQLKLTSGELDMEELLRKAVHV
jgi:tetraacyldisaccharide 4'-kinase